MAFKPIDPKRDEYRRYLERGGVIETLTKVFVRLLHERPDNPTEYLLQNIGDARLKNDQIAYMQSELHEARNEIRRLTDIIRNINPDLLNTDNKSAFENSTLSIETCTEVFKKEHDSANRQTPLPSDVEGNDLIETINYTQITGSDVQTSDNSHLVSHTTDA